MQRIVQALDWMEEPRLLWIEKVTDILNCRHTFIRHDGGVMNEEWVMTFGDGLMIHHAFSNEPFTKDKFEHAMVNTAKMVGMQADFAPRGNRGHDITVGSARYSLKTQADKSIKSDVVWISKYMELGKGIWSDKPEQLDGLRDAFLLHLSASDRILILRCLKKTPLWEYELLEIPKAVFERCATGTMEMKMESRQNPKPGYCHVQDRVGNLAFQLYFDGGGERKLQIKSLRTDLCILHAEWKFDPSESTHDE